MHGFSRTFTESLYIEQGNFATTCMGRMPFLYCNTEVCCDVVFFNLHRQGPVLRFFLHLGTRSSIVMCFYPVFVFESLVYSIV